MANVYLDRLRDERKAINVRVKVGQAVAQATTESGRHTQIERRQVEAALLIAEAVMNLTDTIQTIYEDERGRERT